MDEESELGAAGEDTDNIREDTLEEVNAAAEQTSQY